MGEGLPFTKKAVDLPGAVNSSGQEYQRGLPSWGRTNCEACRIEASLRACIFQIKGRKSGMGSVEILRVSCSPSGNSQMKSMWPLVNPSPSLGNQTQRRGAGHAHSGHPSKILLFGGVTLSPEYSGLKSSSLQFVPCQSLR